MSVESDLLDESNQYIAVIDSESTRIGGVLLDKDNQIASLIAQINSGSQVTVAQLTTLRDGLKSDAAKLNALGNNPPPPAARKHKK